MKLIAALVLACFLLPSNIFVSYIRNRFWVTWDDNLEETDDCPLNSSDSILVINGTEELGIGVMRNITISKSTKTIKDDLNPENGPYTKVCIRRN